MITIQIDEKLKLAEEPGLDRLEEMLVATVRVALADLPPASSQAGEETAPGVAQEITLVLTDDEQLRALNFEFMGIDAPTDVLSFPAGEVNPETGAFYLGDVIISYPQAILQAGTGGHAVLDELRLLAVHGVLHLFGYDHADEEQRSCMWSRQAAILGRLGNSITGPAA